MVNGVVTENFLLPLRGSAPCHPGHKRDQLDPGFNCQILPLLSGWPFTQYSGQLLVSRQGMLASGPCRRVATSHHL